MPKSRARNKAPTKAAPSIPSASEDALPVINEKEASEIDMLVISSLRKLAALFSDESYPGCEGDDAYDNYTDSDLDAGEVDIDPLSDTDPVADDADPSIDNAESHVSIADDVGEESEAELDVESSIDANFDATPILAMTEGTPINRMQKQISDDLREFALRSVRETLLKDDFIRMEALQDGALQLTEKAAHFTMTPDEYNEWLQRHQAQISTNFVQMKGAYKYTGKERKGGKLAYLQCQCAGQKRVIKNRKIGGKSGKQRVGRQSMKKGCEAKIRVITQKTPGPDETSQTMCHVAYCYGHNHDVGNLTGLGTRQKSTAIKATIKRLILGGSTISMVMNQLTMEHDKFMQVMREKGRFSRDDFITYDDVYNIWHSVMANKMRRDKDPVISSMKWMEELEQDGGFAYYNRNDRVNGLYFGFATRWQMTQLQAHGRTICFDGTHNVFGQKTNLFALVVKNTSTGFGVPVAFLLTKTTENSILVGWLRGLRSKMTEIFSTPGNLYVYRPNAVITDQGNVEILAIKTAFAEDSVRIFFCAWHVFRIWEREVRKRVHGITHLTVDKRRALRDEAVAELRSIQKEPNHAEAMSCIQKYREKWKGQTDLLQYLDKRYFGSEQGDNASDIQKHWMMCYRQGVSYASIDTNNYIESWHNILKRHFFRDRHQRRPDTVIYILAFMAVPHFQQKCSRSIMKVGCMSPAQKIEARFRLVAENHLQTRESLGFVDEPVMQIDDKVLRVESFKTPGKTYDILIDFSKVAFGEIISCTCPYFHMNVSCCKHIALVMIQIPQLQLRCDDIYYEDDKPDNKRSLLDAAQRDYLEYTDQIDHPVMDTRTTNLQRLQTLLSLQDEGAPLANGEAIDVALARLVRMVEESVQLKVKRQRQGY